MVTEPLPAAPAEVLAGAACAPGEPLGLQRAHVTAWRGGQARRQTDWLAEEVPVALVFNGLSHAVMMATPCDLDDFALGFALTEGLLHGEHELYGCEVQAVADGIELRLDVSAAAFARLKERRRTLAGRTGCGLCGTDSLAQVRQPLPTAPDVAVSAAAVTRAQAAMRAAQALQQHSGATHAAAWCSRVGEPLLVREDIGRHNALDKVIGAMRRARLNPAEGFFCITSRASFEMVQKAVMAGAGVLTAVSAPTALAVQVAQAANLALAGFVRGDDLVAYTHPHRFGLPPR